LFSRESVAQNTYELSFLLKDEFPFVPGQYVWVELGEDRKAFSICCAPNGRSSISIIFRESTSAYKKALLALPLQSELSIYGPFGSFALPAAPDTPVIFIAGGVGVAPFCSMIQDSIASNSLRPIHLITANSTPERAVYSSEFKRIAKEHKNFTLQEVYGHITLQDLQNLPELHNAIIYTTGPEAMVEAVGGILASLNVSKDQVCFQEFYPSSYAPPNGSLSHDFPVTQDLFMLAVQNTSNHIVLTDIDGRIIFANKAAELLTGYSLEEMRGQTSRLWGGLMDKSFYANLWDTIKVQQKPFVGGKVYNRRKNGVVYTTIMRISPILDREGKLIGFISTEEDVTEFEKISELKTEFVSLASHQLRTPLTVIRWDVEELLGTSGEGALTPSQRKNIEEVHKITLTMIGLVKKLLDVSYLELGQYVLKSESTNLPLVFQNILLEYRAAIKEKKLIVKELYSQDLLEVDTDPEFVQIILQNLISNAVKYTPSGGSVELEISLDKKDGIPPHYNVGEKNIFIRVTDKGVGIPKQQQSRIFQEFLRADNAKALDTTGFGFGLYMTKLIVERASGKIWFESEEGKGTSFYVLLPVF
jgi:PAS domain S-box-containing protein